MNDLREAIYKGIRDYHLNMVHPSPATKTAKVALLGSCDLILDAIIAELPEEYGDKEPYSQGYDMCRKDILSILTAAKEQK